MTYLSQLTVYRSASPPPPSQGGGVPGPFKGMQRERRGRRGQGGSANTLSDSGRADYETLKMTFLGLISVYRNIFLVFCHIILFYYDIAIILFCVNRSAIKKKIYIYIYIRFL